MSSPNRASTVELPGVAGLARRFRISDNVKRDAEGAMKTAVELLGVAADMTQNVPYLGIVSGVLSELLKIFGEIELFKSDWETTMHITKQIKAIIDVVSVQYGSDSEGESGLPPALEEALIELEKSVVVALEILTKCRSLSKSIRDRVRTALNRNDLMDEVKQCQTRMQAALSLFIAKLQVDQSIAVHAILDLLQNGQTPSPSLSIADIVIPTIISLPPPPPIFHGRAHEVDHVVDLVLRHAPARIAILGPGGIGKTSIAVAVLHDARVEERFAEQRFFVSCEAVHTADGIIQELAKLFDVAVDPTGKISLSDALLSHLRTREPGVLCLDNMETPWDEDDEAIEAFLGKLAHVTRLSLVITMRITDLPGQVAWTQPALPPIMPLTFEASMQTWDAFCQSHDEYAEKLVRAVDCVPLAVTLLAKIAKSETSKLLWTRWEREETRLLRLRRGRKSSDHRLQSVETSIQLSLDSPRLRDDNATQQLLGTLCHLPQGLRESRISIFADAFEGTLPEFYESITLLKQCSLIYSTDSKEPFLRVLSPIRHYVRARYPIHDSLFGHLSDIYCALVDFQSDDFGPRVKYLKSNLAPEMENILTVLTGCLTRDTSRLERALQSIVKFARLSRSRYVFHDSLLCDAIMCSDNYPLLGAQLRDAQGHYLRFRGRYNEALAIYSSALDQYRSALDRRGEGECLKYIGDTYRHLGWHAEAETNLRLACDISAETGHYWAQAESLSCLGSIYIDTPRRFDEGKQMLKDALVIFGKAHDNRGVASCMLNLGVIYSGQRQFHKAGDLLTAALRLHSSNHDTHGQAECFYALGRFYVRLRDTRMAKHVMHLGQRLFHKVNDELGAARCQIGLSSLYTQTGKPDKAEASLQSALRIFRDRQDRHGQVVCLQKLGELCKEVGRLGDAERALKTALDLCSLDDTRHRGDKAGLWLALASLRRSQNRADEARTLLRSSYDIFHELSYTGGRATALHLLSSVYRDLDDFDKAESCLMDAWRLCIQTRPPEKPEKEIEDTIKVKLQILRAVRRSKVLPRPSISPLTERDTTMSTIKAAPSHRSIIRARRAGSARKSDHSIRRVCSFP
ncbi:unnamed protein product [Peniophora sp. CBMAI 1063]|nr:unnamed protein product [Peniophora sp. CBMAI 1063]